MAMPNDLADAIADRIDRVAPDAQARKAARRELAAIRARLDGSACEAQSCDPWTRRARPAFLYVIYLLLLWAIPMGMIAAIRPAMADAMTKAMNAYLNAIPESLYALFGTGYLGYTAARAWGKAKGVDK